MKHICLVLSKMNISMGRRHSGHRCRSSMAACKAWVEKHRAAIVSMG